MSLRTSRWPAGVPCWADLMVPDMPAAAAFYSAVLGWTVPEPDEEYGGYVVAHVGGAAVAGIAPERPGARTGWTLYVATDDADATVRAAIEHGGTGLLPPGDVGPLGRIGVVADPTGAVFGLWQAGTMIGASLVNEPGGLTWEDLRSTDPDVARAFYTAVFGYRSDPVPGAGPDYATFALPSEQTPLGGIGGMYGMDAAGSHWIVYFGVPDATAACTTAEQHGGSVAVRDFDTPYGRMAGLVDPSGVTFWVTQAPEGAPQPDRAG